MTRDQLIEFLRELFDKAQDRAILLDYERDTLRAIECLMDAVDEMIK